MLDVEKFVDSLTAEQQHDMAKVGVLDLLKNSPGRNLKRILSGTGLCEIRAKLAIKQLLEEDKVYYLKENGKKLYYLVNANESI